MFKEPSTLSFRYGSKEGYHLKWIVLWSIREFVFKEEAVINSIESFKIRLKERSWSPLQMILLFMFFYRFQQEKLKKVLQGILMKIVSLDEILS